VIARPLGLLAAAVAVAAAGLLSGRGTSTAGAGPALDGATVFHAKGCAMCHDAPGWTSPIGEGPSLRDAPSWAASRIPGTSAEDYVRLSVVAPRSFISPRAMNPEFLMPAISVSAEELDALVAHLLPRR
jgi:Cytochrome c